MDGVQLPQGLSHFEEAVYFLPLSSQKFLVLRGEEVRRDSPQVAGGVGNFAGGVFLLSDGNLRSNFDPSNLFQN